MKRVIVGFWNRWFGLAGERAAEKYLRKKGLRTLARSYRVRRGEIDLVMRDGRVVVFIEVKSRQSGRPSEAVDEAKQRKIALAALQFLKRHKLLEYQWRFDIVAIVWPGGEGKPTIEHFVNAFDSAAGRNMFG